VTELSSKTHYKRKGRRKDKNEGRQERRRKQLLNDLEKGDDTRNLKWKN
jgi:hypothetical protein